MMSMQPSANAPGRSNDSAKNPNRGPPPPQSLPQKQPQTQGQIQSTTANVNQSQKPGQVQVQIPNLGSGQTPNQTRGSKEQEGMTKANPSANPRLSSLPLTPSVIVPFVAARQVTEGISKFTAGLRSVLKTRYNMNMMFSPFSLSSMGAVLYLGSKGQTHKEIGAGFSFPVNMDLVKAGFASLMSSMKESSQGFALDTAQRIYCQKRPTPVLPEFLKAVQDTFSRKEVSRAAFVETDFYKHKEAASAINEWIDEQTNGTIQQVFNPGDLDSRICILGVSGVHLQGDWAIAFDPEDTKKVPFYVHKNLTVSVDMMTKVSSFPYCFIKSVKAHCLCIPFGNLRSQLNFLLLVPDSPTGLLEVEKNLHRLGPNEMVKELQVNKVIHLFLPKFKMRCQIDFAEPFKEMGMKTMFKDLRSDEKKEAGEFADFSGISKSSSSSLSAIIQKVRLAVCEKGCWEGPDCSKVTPKSKSVYTAPVKEGQSPDMHVEVRADRPFIFEVVDMLSLNILIFGVCRNPVEAIET